MRKTLLFLLLIFSLSWVISCQKSVKQDPKKEAKPSLKLGNSKSTLPITQESPDELVYAPGESEEPIDLLSIEYNPGTKVVSSTMTLSDFVPGITYAISFNDLVWKTHQTTQIEQKAADLSSYDLSQLQIQTTIADLEAIMSDVISSASPEVLYSLSINISIFKTLARTAVNPSDCNCTVHPSFLVGESYFLCQEDHFYNKANLAAALDQYEAEFGQTPDATAIKQYVQSFQGSAIPFTNVYELLVSAEEFEEAVVNIQNGSGDCAWWCPLGCGTDHGCCGNYKGCCFYRHIACYIHDKMCINCEPPWFCGPQCQPGDDWIPDPADDPEVPTDPDNPDYDDTPLTSEYADYWNYLNAVKSWAIDQSGAEPIPVEYNEADLISKINGFSAANPSNYELPENASEPRFIYRAKNFVTGAYLQYPGAASSSPAPIPDIPPF